MQEFNCKLITWTSEEVCDLIKKKGGGIVIVLLFVVRIACANVLLSNIVGVL